MPPRKWRTLPTCAALLLATTGCALGPTIHDAPKKPAAATAGPGQTQSTGSSDVGGTSSGGDASAGPTAGAGPSSAPPSRQPTEFRIGGDDTPFQLDEGTWVGVRRISFVGPSDRPGLTRFAVELTVRNAASRPWDPYTLELQIGGCSSGTCAKRGSEAGDPVTAGATATLQRFFDADHQQLNLFTVSVIDYSAAVTGRFKAPDAP